MLPELKWTPWACRDLAECIDFIRMHESGRPAERLSEIHECIEEIRRAPEISQVRSRRRRTGMEYRRRNVAQFAIIYVYVPPDALFPSGLVSIRAIRHARGRNVFHGVREPLPPQYSVPPGTSTTSADPTVRQPVV